VEGYKAAVLTGFDAAAFVRDLSPDAQVVALLCVEREPGACHRSLLANYLHAQLGAVVRHLTP
jgi:uncharacterized protein (DUF488 family)